MEGIFGLAALGFWLFVAAAAVAGIWDGVRRRDAEHETLRRMIESGKQPSPELVDKLLGQERARARPQGRRTYRRVRRAGTGHTRCGAQLRRKRRVNALARRFPAGRFRGRRLADGRKIPRAGQSSGQH